MEPNRKPEQRRILRATAIAAGVAAVILVVAVLPAEYGIDPLGTGRALGLTALAGTADAQSPGAAPPVTLEAVRLGVNTPQTGALGQDQFEVELRPFEGVEYKYRMEKGATMVYSWQATEKVAYEFHGEPDGAPAKYFESYDKSENTHVQGMFVAPTTGIHGWYWKNPGVSRVTVTLKTSGFYGSATEFRDGKRIVHEPTRR
jgi:hypothetical protein